jgi:hypothetical protein
MSEWEQIHAQINAIVRAIPEHFLLDPPDGGDVTVAEGVMRMAARIEQLEAALQRLRRNAKPMMRGWIDAALDA